MEVRELRVLLAVCDAGSISAAARALHASQSSVSETVGSLERQVGQALFERSRSGVTVTGAGTRLAEAARAIVGTHDRVLAELRGADAGGGVLRLGVPLEFPAAVLTRATAAVAAAHPDVRVDLRPGASSAQLAALRRGELDAALLRDRPREEELDSALALAEPLGVVLASDAAPPEAVPLERLAGLRWVGFARDESPLWWDSVAALLRVHGVAVDADPSLGGPLTAEVKRAAVADGRSFALAPAEVAGTLPDGVGWRPLAGDPLVRRTWVAWRADTTRRDVAALVGALES